MFYLFSTTLNNKYPVFGTYVCGSEFSGIYTRLGSEITDMCCMYMPTYIENSWFMEGQMHNEKKKDCK